MIDDSFSKALLHFDGADATTSFVDESGKVWTANGNAQIDTAQYKFGGSSALFDGTGDWIDTPDHADFDVGAGEWTIDFWVKLVNINKLQRCFGQSNSTATATTISFHIYINVDNTVAASVYNSAGTNKDASTTATLDTNFHHIALLRTGNTLKLFVDGVVGATTADLTGFTVNNSANKVAIGALGEYTGNTLDGRVDEFRFSKGVARWTANFTPPDVPYGRIQQAILF